MEISLFYITTIISLTILVVFLDCYGLVVFDYYNLRTVMSCRWSEAKCLSDGITVTGAHQRKVLGEALSLIRFPLMTIEEFAQGPAQSDILTDKEIVQLFLYFTVSTFC